MPRQPSFRSYSPRPRDVFFPQGKFPTQLTEDEARQAYYAGRHRDPTPSGRGR